MNSHSTNDAKQTKRISWSCAKTGMHTQRTCWTVTAVTFECSLTGVIYSMLAQAWRCEWINHPSFLNQSKQQDRFSMQTGGDTFCHWIFLSFSSTWSAFESFCVPTLAQWTMKQGDTFKNRSMLRFIHIPNNNKQKTTYLDQSSRTVKEIHTKIASAGHKKRDRQSSFLTKTGTENNDQHSHVKFVSSHATTPC